MRATGTIALVSLLALGLCASTASAEPLSMTFTEARANVGVQLSDEALFEAPDTAPFEAQIDPGTGEITAGELQVPQFSTFITEPIEADVSVDFDIGTITGAFTQATGALSLSGEAGGTLTSEGPEFEGEECTVLIPETLTLTTAGSSGGDNPRSGALFTAGLSGAGAIAGQWTDMQAMPVNPEDVDNVDFCNNVENRIDEEGGVWLDHEGDPGDPGEPAGGGDDSPPPPPALPSPPADTFAPVGSKLKFAPRRFRPGRYGTASVSRAGKRKGKRRGPPRASRMSYRLSEAATVRFVVLRRTVGRRQGRRCLIGKRARRLRDRKRCVRFFRRGVLSHSGVAGTNRLRFSGRVGGKGLRPGAYRMIGFPTDAAGNRGRPFSGSFVIARR
jgi:hypothetical protein